MQYWLVKQEPDAYPFTQLVTDKSTAWTGVRNFQARNHLRAMKKGDRAFYYHSGEERRIVGLAEIIRVAYTDPTAAEGDWSCVDLRAKQVASQPLSLTAIKAEPRLKGLPLIRQSRLSVMPVGTKEAALLGELTGLKL